jgi:hypothetical protein
MYAALYFCRLYTNSSPSFGRTSRLLSLPSEVSEGAQLARILISRHPLIAEQQFCCSHLKTNAALSFMSRLERLELNCSKAQVAEVYSRMQGAAKILDAFILLSNT